MKSGIVVLGYGPQSIGFIADASAMCGDGAMIDTNIARQAGADFAIGSRAAIEQLAVVLELGALAKAQKAHANSNLSIEAIQWLATGERGTSANTMFTAITGVDVLGEWGPDHPYDPSDFSRCLGLLEACPELAGGLDKVRAISPQWNALIDHWDNLSDLINSESPLTPEGRSGRAPITYNAIKNILNDLD